MIYIKTFSCAFSETWRAPSIGIKEQTGSDVLILSYELFNAEVGKAEDDRITSAFD